MPFARYVLENAGKLAFPFRRYQIQKVWRGERPQEGRYREFTQADIDVVDVGELAPHFEAEMPLVIAEVFRKFPVGEFVIQVNNRKIPEGFYHGIGIDRRHRDPAHRRQARQARAGEGQGRCSSRRARRPSRPTSASRSPAIRSTDLGFVEQVRALGVEHPLLDEGLESPRPTSSAPEWPTPRASSSPTCAIARGLDYYTGTVYETQFVGSRVVGLVLLRRALRRARLATARPPTPASASRSA